MRNVIGRNVHLVVQVTLHSRKFKVCCAKSYSIVESHYPQYNVDTCSTKPVLIVQRQCKESARSEKSVPVVQSQYPQYKVITHSTKSIPIARSQYPQYSVSTRSTKSVTLEQSQDLHSKANYAWTLGHAICDCCLFSRGFQPSGPQIIDLWRLSSALTTIAAVVVVEVNLLSVLRNCSVRKLRHSKSYYLHRISQNWLSSLWNSHVNTQQHKALAPQHQQQVHTLSTTCKQGNAV